MDFFSQNCEKNFVEHQKIFVEIGMQLSKYFFKDKCFFNGYIEVVCKVHTTSFHI